MRRRAFIAGGGILVAAAAGGALYSGRGGDQKEVGIPTAETAPSPAPKVPDMILGDPSRGVEIIEYASFTCPHCAAFHAETMPRIRDELIATGKAHFIFREVYFDRPGLWASLIARAAGEDRFFAFADLLYERQRDWARGTPDEIEDHLRRLAKISGIDDDAVAAVLEDQDRAVRLMRWYEQNARRDGISATPTILVDGRDLGPAGFQPIRKAVDRAASAPVK